MAKGRRLHALRRPKLRQSWNKYNLYNIQRVRNPRIGSGDHETFFQQKWRAKGLVRSYHGEHIKERDWERMFSRRLLSAVDMNPQYLANNDGSEQATGRGSGLDKRPNWDKEEILPRSMTPYMNMAFAPMERRLDIAIFRAMFASSARQARQFCIHGAVKVNGKKMPFPSYKLNPGDMFQVDPEKVLYATGKPKPQMRETSAKAESTEEVAEEPEPEAEEPAEAEEASPAADPQQDPDTTDKPEQVHDLSQQRKDIRSLVKQAKSVLKNEDLGVAKKRTLRSFIKQARKISSESNSSPTEVIAKLNSLMSELKLSEPEPESVAEATEASANAGKTEHKQALLEILTPTELSILERKIKEEEQNPYDPDKPYMTPWRPRDYMAPFAYIPRYLEVNSKICSAVYLRHPIAKPGTAEVPTPFGYSVNQLAFNWYLRRR